jgi:hypothetical protein
MQPERKSVFLRAKSSVRHTSSLVFGSYRTADSMISEDIGLKQGLVPLNRLNQKLHCMIQNSPRLSWMIITMDLHPCRAHAGCFSGRVDYFSPSSCFPT